MRKTIRFDSYNDSAQARHLKSWVNQNSVPQKDKLLLTKEICIRATEESKASFTVLNTHKKYKF